jgi:hypothetical protein
MNEFANQGPPVPARPVGQPSRLADTPVWVHIVCDAGIASPVARELGQDEERDLFRALARLDPGAWKVRDFTLSAGDGFVLDSPARSQIAVRKTGDEVYALLGGEPRWADKAPPLVPASPARPSTPVRVRIVWDAGIPSPVARELGQPERDLFRALVSPDPDARRLPDVQYADFRLSAGGGFVVDNPELPQIAVGKNADAINVLLVPDRSDPFPLGKLRPYDPIQPLRPDDPIQPIRPYDPFQP